MDPIPDEFSQDAVSPNFTGSLIRAFFFQGEKGSNLLLQPIGQVPRMLFSSESKSTFV